MHESCLEACIRMLEYAMLVEASDNICTSLLGRMPANEQWICITQMHATEIEECWSNCYALGFYVSIRQQANNNDGPVQLQNFLIRFSLQTTTNERFTTLIAAAYTLTFTADWHIDWRTASVMHVWALPSCTLYNIGIAASSLLQHTPVMPLCYPT